MNPRIDALRTQFDEYRTQIEDIRNRAVADGSDLTDEQTAQIDELFNRANALKPVIEAEVAKANALNETAALFGKLAADVPAGSPVVRADAPKNVGEYFFNYLRSEVHPARDETAAVKNRALSVVDSSQSAGLLPYTIQGDVIRFVDSKRYTIDSLTNFAVPAGASFKKRVETGTATIAAQGSENTEIGSSQVTISYVDVSHATYAGGVRITLQADNFTDPLAAEQNLRSMVEQYAITTDTVVAAALKTAANVVVPLPVTGATPAKVFRAIGSATQSIYSRSKTFANTIWMTPDVALWLVGLEDSAGNLGFPILAPNNVDGSASDLSSMTFGLRIPGYRVVVSPNFASSTFIVGNSKWGEVYESMYPMLSAVQPSTLSREIAMAGELGTYFRSEGFVELVDTDGDTGATPNFG